MGSFTMNIPPIELTMTYWLAGGLAGLGGVALIVLAWRFARRGKSQARRQRGQPTRMTREFGVTPTGEASDDLELPEVTPSNRHQPIQRQRVESSNVNSVGYDEATQTLQIGFGGEERDDRIYEYVGVSDQVYERLLAAPSKGHFVWEELIRNPDAPDGRLVWRRER
jgi:hypothetical protein